MKQPSLRAGAIVPILLVAAVSPSSMAGAGRVAHPAIDSGKCSAKVRMIRWDGIRPGVHVWVNGKGPYLFLIDTGAGGLARADTRLVEALSLSPTGAAPRDDGSAAAQAAQSTMPEYILDRISFGGMTRRQVHTPSRNYNGNSKRGIDGILGYGFFEGCLLTLDFEREEVRVSGGQLEPARGTISYGRDEGGPEVLVRIGGIRVRANLDTGDNEGFSLPEKISSRLRFKGAPRTVGTGHSANNTYEVREAPLDAKIRIGDVEWIDPPVSFADVFSNINIGSAALQGTTITFDQARKLVRIARRR